VEVNAKLVALLPVALILLLNLASDSLQAPSLIRGPYLQMRNDHAITIHWRTNIPTDSVVRFGSSPGRLNNRVADAVKGVEHVVRLESLEPGQRYWYSVGSSRLRLAGDDSFHFQTSPPPGTGADTRIWVIGDSGTADENSAAVRDAYTAWAGTEPADLWLMLGDNAYNDGTDRQYQAAVFETYPVILRQLPVWPTLGNHDGHTADSATQSGPYYDIFDLPAGGEAGGLASGTEAYYSFEHANIHFICLDSYESDRDPGGSMLQWLEADLASNTQPWVIAYWHHPPYSKGSHDSDTEHRLIDMRRNALPVLETWGVDLMLSGHSHSYERSMLMDGHYGLSGSLDPAVHLVDAGDGRETGDGAYLKPGEIALRHGGAVYAVAGSAGKTSGGPLDHPIMVISLNSLGSLILDVSGLRMDVTFIDRSAVERDRFSIVKTTHERRAAP